MKALAAALAAVASTTVNAGVFNSLNFLVAIPTLDEIGLGLLIALVAGVAGWAVRKRGGRR